MSGLNDDIQSMTAVKPLAAMTEFAIGVGATNVSASVDTSLNGGFNAALFSLATDRALAAADLTTFVYKFQDSDDDSVWTDVVVDGHLPYRKNPERTFVIAQDGYVQTVGVFSTKKFVRLSVTGTADTTALNITPTAILRSDLVEFTGYDIAVVPDDGQP